MPNEATEVKWTNVKGTVSSEWTQEGMKLPANTEWKKARNERIEWVPDWNEPLLIEWT